MSPNDISLDSKDVQFKCRICHESLIEKVLDLGAQPLSGVFLQDSVQGTKVFPLVLFCCSNCSLVQLGKSVELEEMYGDSYGYRSGLNETMVNHLSEVAAEICSRIDFEGDSAVVLDIGSNDGTFLHNFDKNVFTRIGMDPSAQKFLQFYDEDIKVLVDFFSKSSFTKVENRPPNLVTSIAMFYDLEDPMQFARDIHEILVEGGYWYLEVCYGPWVAGMGAFDTICHEHLEYYSLENLEFIFRETGFRVVHTLMSNSNGVSIGVLVQKDSKNLEEALVQENVFGWLLEVEKSNELNSVSSWRKSAELVQKKKKELNDLIAQIKASGKTIYGMGASTKGNVLLNYLGVDAKAITAIGEVNVSKFGKFMPGSGIPIIAEEEVLEAMPDYILFLPWHFREFAISKYANYIEMGGKIIFPLPALEIYGK
jgi:hypothetical protein